MDESPDVPPKKKKRKNITEPTVSVDATAEQQTPDTPVAAESTPIETVDPLIIADQTSLSDEVPAPEVSELSQSIENELPPESAESSSEESIQTASEPNQILSSDGHDPAAIALQINAGQEGGGDIDINLNHFDGDSLLQQVAGVFLLWWHWAYFEITVTAPTFPIYNPPKILVPQPIPSSDDLEFVYDIYDFGNKLRTSKGVEMYSAGMSMCKLFYTIEKMIFILIKRIKDEGISTDTEVQVMFDGHLLAQRKAFESIINLNYNVVVTNFDPGVWGERYLEIVKRLSDRGYGYPSEAPREIYKITKRTTSPTKP